MGEKYSCSAVNKHQQHNFKIKWNILILGWVVMIIMTIMLGQRATVINAWEKTLKINILSPNCHRYETISPTTFSFPSPILPNLDRSGKSRKCTCHYPYFVTRMNIKEEGRKRKKKGLHI